MSTDAVSRLSTPGFWTQTLEDRMADFAEIRELDPFVPITYLNPLTNEEETFFALTPELLAN